MALIEAEALWKDYPHPAGSVEALKGISFSVDRGEFVAVMGPSGSGKSTLLNILGCLDRPSAGSYRLEGRSVGQLSDAGRTRVRRERVGFVFQSYNLIPQLSALQNIELPLFYRRMGRRERRRRALEAAQAVGLGSRIHHRPAELSGGEQQRVAIARALANDPAILLADEPTGNLDLERGLEVMELLAGLHRQGRTIVLVTHNERVAGFAWRFLHLADGRLSSRPRGPAGAA